MGEGARGKGENGEGIKYRWAVTESHGDGKYSIGNVVNNPLISMCAVRWAQDLLGRSLSKLCNV